MVVEIDNFEAIKKGQVLVDFYTTSCAPCKMLSPVLEELSKEFSDLKIAKVDVTKNPEASSVFGVMSVPTIMFLQDYRVKEVAHGFSNKNTIKIMIQKHIGNAG